jgi:hypothetical protein
MVSTCFTSSLLRIRVIGLPLYDYGSKIFAACAKA